MPKLCQVQFTTAILFWGAKTNKKDHMLQNLQVGGNEKMLAIHWSYNLG